MYNGLLSTNYKIVKECIEQKEIQSITDAETVWKEILSENTGGINMLKQKLLAMDSTKQYPLDSIAYMNNYHVTVSYPTRLTSILINNNTWEEFVYNYIKVIETIRNIETMFSKEDMPKLLDSVFNNKLIINNLTILQTKPQKEYLVNIYGTNLYGSDAIIFITDLQEQISNNKIKTMDDIKKYNNDVLYRSKNYIDNRKKEILNNQNVSSELDYILYFIKTSNPWVINYTRNLFVDLYNECNGNISNIKEETNKLQDSEVKAEYNEIFSQTIKDVVRIKLSDEQQIIINKFQDMLDNIQTSENTYDFDCQYEYWLRALSQIDQTYIKCLQVNNQQEVVNDLLTKIWTLYNNPKLQNIINKYLNSNYTNPAKTEQAMIHLHNNLKNTLNNAGFKNKTPFDQFKQLITLVP